MRRATILHIPHSATIIPDEHRHRILLSDDELQTELLRMTDWFTDELFTPGDKEYASVRYPISRIVLDPERFEDDDKEVMALRGMGLIYTKTADGKVLRAPPSEEERQSLIQQYYHPHHASLLEAVETILMNEPAALVIDCHSFPSQPLPYEIDQNTERPDICIGTDDYHTPPWLTDLATSLVVDAGFSVAVNRPFSGTLVPAKHFNRARSVSGIMLELNRQMYMDEVTGNRGSGFNEVQGKVQSLLESLTEGFVRLFTAQ
jgi:N-formylglutamate amidohydrolase